ncbi:MAG: rhodanese-like domain-containing protein, partial [Burkholderiaceae bacterium]
SGPPPPRAAAGGPAPPRPIVVVCRSGHRSVLAADVLQTLGFADVVSLKTGVRGWNDFEQPLVNAAGVTLDADTAERLLAARVRPDQRRPVQARGAAPTGPAQPAGGAAPKQA